jgi:hypothetical protein
VQVVWLDALLDAGHEFASNSASNTEEREPTPKGGPVESVAPAGGKVGTASEDTASRAPAKQRWGREAYNAYQREYMRKKRK